MFSEPTLQRRIVDPGVSGKFRTLSERRSPPSRCVGVPAMWRACRCSGSQMSLARGYFTELRSGGRGLPAATGDDMEWNDGEMCALKAAVHWLRVGATIAEFNMGCCRVSR